MTLTNIAPSDLERYPAVERDHDRDFSQLAERLERDGHVADAVVAAVQRFEVALPSWALATGGTRFGRFPGLGEPVTLREKMEDVALVHQRNVFHLLAQGDRLAQPRKAAKASATRRKGPRRKRDLESLYGGDHRVGDVPIALEALS